jgi:hypothetical protein
VRDRFIGNRSSFLGDLVKFSSLVAAAALSLVAASGAGTAIAAPTPVASVHTHAIVAKHACTKTSSGSCIRGGEFCPQASYGHSGWDARGHRYVCKGNHVHPHWMLP